MRKFIFTSLVSIPSLIFAAAGIADRFAEHQKWIFPAYANCLKFGLLILISMFIVTLIYKEQTQAILGRVSHYMINRPIIAIIFSGFLLAIPIGLICAILWEVLWVFAIFPVMGLMIIFPIIPASKRLREKYLLSVLYLKWSLLISISAIMASSVFIVLTNCHILPDTETSLWAPWFVSRSNSYTLTHPCDSMKEIWKMPLILIVEIIISITVYLLGILNRYIRKKISLIRSLKLS